MFEFLKECDSHNMYDRAHDCEITLNAFNSVTSISVFFETSFKILYGELCPKGRLNEYSGFDEFLNDRDFKQKLKDEYNFTAINTIHEIRKKNNDLKHKKQVSSVEEKNKKKSYFKLAFIFSSNFYHKKTGKPKPEWSDKTYEKLLRETYNEESRNNVEQELRSTIEKYSKEKQEKEQLFQNACLKIETLQSQLETIKTKNISKDEKEKLESELQALKDAKTESETRLMLLQGELSKAEQEKLELQEKAELYNKAKEKEAEATKRENAILSMLEKAKEKIKSLLKENSSLEKQIESKDKEYIAYKNKAEEIYIASANSEKLKKATEKLHKAEEECAGFSKKIIELTAKLDEAKNKLYVEDSPINSCYAEYRKAEEKIKQYKTSIEDGETCKTCGSSVSVRQGVASKKYFLGCNKFPKCNGYGRFLSYEEKVKLNELDQERLKIQKKLDDFISDNNLAKDHQMATYVCHPVSLESRHPVFSLFQSLAVPPEIFTNRENFGLEDYSRFFFVTKLKQKKVEAAKQSIYSLALRAMNRGIVLPSYHKTVEKLKTKFNQKSFGRIEALFSYAQYRGHIIPYDSENERKFAENCLAAALGPQWSVYTIPQADGDLLNLLPEDKKSFAEQRVDFLVVKDGKKVVIEIDGPEHREGANANGDKIRKALLLRNGYDVLRFTNEEVCNYPERIIEKLKETFPESDENKKYTNIDDRYLVAVKLVHQLAVAILKSLEKGYIAEVSRLDVDISTRMFSNAEARYILAVAVEEVKDIVKHYSDIYVQRINLDFFNDNEKTLTIYVGNGKSSDVNSVVIRDCVLSFNSLCDIMPFDHPGVVPCNISLTAIEFFLKYIFGYDHLRGGQFEAIKRLLEEKDSVILLPTGAGKSIIYQLSSYIVPGMIVIISPLKALMVDQKANLHYNNGIDNAVTIMSASDQKGKDNIAEQLRSLKNNTVSMLYIAPERLQIPEFRKVISMMMASNSVFTLAIDEAHCVSEWGHDFRPSYLNIANVTKEIFKKGEHIPAITALTGTASGNVLRDVKVALDITENDAVILPPSFDRKELHFGVVHCSAENKFQYIADIIKTKLPEHFEISYNDLAKLNGTETKSGIVFAPYAAPKKPSNYGAIYIEESLSKALPELGIASYFSKVPDGVNPSSWEALIRENADNFKKNKINLLVATKAYGMGIDKSNVRFIIHNGMPSSLEQYYQEAGRAGRGREDSFCYLVFSDDLAETNEPLLNPNLTIDELQKKYSSNSTSSNDDLSSILLFHTGTYKGISRECEVVDKILGRINQGCFDRRECVNILRFEDKSDDEAEKNILKAVIRLVTIGVLKDYTYDYRNQLLVTCQSTDRKFISKKFIEYIERDNHQRAEAERQFIEECSETGLEFVRIVVRQLVTYIYDNIEKARRAAASLMYTTVKDAAALPPDKQDQFIRKAILDYFNEHSDDNSVSTIMESKNAGITMLRKIVDFPSIMGAVTDETVEKFRSLNLEIGRQLESVPDQPAFIFMRALCGLVVKNVSAQQITDDIIAAVKFARARYSVDNGVLLGELKKVLSAALCQNEDVFDNVIDQVDEAGINSEEILGEMINDKENTDEMRDYLIAAYLEQKLKK